MYNDRLGTAAQCITFIEVYISILHKAGKVFHCFVQRKLCFAVNHFIFSKRTRHRNLFCTTCWEKIKLKKVQLWSATFLKKTGDVVIVAMQTPRFDRPRPVVRASRVAAAL